MLHPATLEPRYSKFIFDLCATLAATPLVVLVLLKGAAFADQVGFWQSLALYLVAGFIYAFIAYSIRGKLFLDATTPEIIMERCRLLGKPYIAPPEEPGKQIS